MRRITGSSPANWPVRPVALANEPCWVIDGIAIDGAFGDTTGNGDAEEVVAARRGSVGGNGATTGGGVAPSSSRALPVPAPRDGGTGTGVPSTPTEVALPRLVVP